MSKVDWINWKTDPKEIINPDKIIEKIEDDFQNYNCYMNAVVYEGIKHEIEYGGLDKLSLNIMGVSPANEKAMDILNQIDEIKSIMDNLKREVSRYTKTQKEIEKEQLIQSIEAKIEEEEKILHNTNKLNERINSNNPIISKQRVEEIIEITKERIKKLQERLELAKQI